MTSEEIRRQQQSDTWISPEILKAITAFVGICSIVSVFVACTVAVFSQFASLKDGLNDISEQVSVLAERVENFSSQADTNSRLLREHDRQIQRNETLLRNRQQQQVD